MLFNPVNKQLFTNEGVFIKQLYCPLKVKWSDLRPVGFKQRICDHCDKNIIATSSLDDAAVVTIVEHDANACLKINLNDENVRVTDKNV